MRNLKLHAGVASLGLFLALTAAPAASAQWLVPTAGVYSYGRPYLPTSYYATAYTLPTTYAPTSYVGASYVPTSYVSSAYYAPTSYLSTAYYAPTSYLSTSYVPTSYLPTSYYAPTSYYLPTSYYSSLAATGYYVPTTSLVATSAVPCADPPAQAVPTSVNPPRNSGGTKVNSSAKTVPSNVDNPRPRPLVVEPPLGSDPGLAPVDPRTAPAAGDSPPRPDVPDDIPVAPPLTNRVEKPRPPSRVVLMGHVYEHPAGARTADASAYTPLEGVEVTVASQATPKTFVDRRTITDAHGRFAVTIPDGDWEVNVPDAKGKPISQKITISGGVITTDKGREVPSIDFIR